MGERGVSLDHSTIYRWVQSYAPEIERRLRWQWRQPRSTSWRVDETYIKVRGKWAYLYRAVDKFGSTIDFYLSPTRSTAAAKRFLGKTLKGLKHGELPHVINTDKAPTYPAALAELKKQGACPEDTVHRQAKYLNNVVEADHGKLKLLIRPVRGFKTLKTAYATIKGFEVMRALRKAKPGPSTSPATSAARRASSSVPSGSAAVLSRRPSGSSASGSNSKQPDRAASSIAASACPCRQIATEPSRLRQAVQRTNWRVPQSHPVSVRCHRARCLLAPALQAQPP